MSGLRAACSRVEPDWLCASLCVAVQELVKSVAHAVCLAETLPTVAVAPPQPALGQKVWGWTGIGVGAGASGEGGGGVMATGQRPHASLAREGMARVPLVCSVAHQHMGREAQKPLHQGGFKAEGWETDVGRGGGWAAKK